MGQIDLNEQRLQVPRSQSVRARLRRLGGKPSGQAITEYLFLLAFAVGILMTLFKSLIAPKLTQLTTSVSQKIERQFLGSDLHYFPVGR